MVRDSFDLVVFHQVLHFLDDPAPAIAEAATALSPAGRMLVVDFAPHELEFLRQSQAHRRLGFGHAQMEQWLKAAGLELEAVEALAPAENFGGLTVTIWTALDRRAVELGRGAGEAKS